MGDHNAAVTVTDYPLNGAYRVARRESPLSYSRITPPDAQTTVGNRYDVAGGGVLYCASSLDGCFAETLARLRPSPAVIAALGSHEDGRMNLGSVPADWRLRRVRLRVLCDEPLPFLDVEAPGTLAVLGEVLAADLAVIGIDRPLDVALMRGADRRVPRLVSRWAYNQQNDEGTPQFSGIRYESKLGNYECWAIFDGTPVRSTDVTPVNTTDEALTRVAKNFGLTIH